MTNPLFQTISIFSRQFIPTQYFQLFSIKNVVGDKYIRLIVSHNNRVEVVWKYFREKKSRLSKSQA